MGYLSENERKEATRKNVIILRKLLKQEISEEIVEQEVERIMADTKKLELHNRAASIQKARRDKFESSHLAEKKFKELYGVEPTVNEAFQRSRVICMDPKKTPDALDKNIELLETLSDTKKNRGYLRGLILDIQGADIKKCCTTDPNEILDAYEENLKVLDLMFVICFDIRGGFKPTGPAANFLKNRMTAIQALSVINQSVEMMSSDAYISAPELPKDYKTISTLMPGFVELQTDKELGSYVTKVTEDFCTKYLGSGTTLANESKGFEKLIDLMKRNIIGGDFLNYKAMENGVEIPLMTGIERYGENGITIEHLSPLELEEVKESLYCGIMETGKVHTVMEEKRDQILGLKDILGHANYKHFSQNSPQYDSLMTKLNQFGEAYQNIARTANEEEYAQFKKDLKDITKLADEYIQAKKNQTKNRHRQTRYDTCFRLKEVCGESAIDREVFGMAKEDYLRMSREVRVASTEVTKPVIVLDETSELDNNNPLNKAICNENSEIDLFVKD